MGDRISKLGRIYQRGPKWYVDIREPDGTRFRRSVGTSGKHAQRVLNNKRQALRDSAPEDYGKGGPTVAACWRHYLERSKKENKASTVASVKTIRKRWSALERKAVSRLQQSDIDGIVDKMPVAISTKNASIKVLRAALRRAKRDKLIADTPVELIERPHVKSLPLTVTREEFRSLLRNCSDYRAKTLVCLAMFAGLRHAECQHLVLGDIDWDQKLLRVTAKPSCDWSPKTYEERAIPISPVLAQTLKNHIALMPERAFWLVERDAPEWLFPGARGDKPLVQQTTKGLVRAAFDAAGIGGHRPGLHRLRKTWATNILKSGKGLGVLMRLGGWNHLETVKVYIGTDTDAAREAIASLEF